MVVVLRFIGISTFHCLLPHDGKMLLGKMTAGSFFPLHLRICRICICEWAEVQRKKRWRREEKVQRVETEVNMGTHLRFLSPPSLTVSTNDKIPTNMYSEKICQIFEETFTQIRR